jgi:hypothetical protein
MGAFFSLMSTTFAYEDPLSRTWQTATMNTSQNTAQIFKDMGKGMWRSGKGFGSVGALYAGSECVIEGVRPYALSSFALFRLSAALFYEVPGEKRYLQCYIRRTFLWCSPSPKIRPKSHGWWRCCFCRFLRGHRHVSQKRYVGVCTFLCLRTNANLLTY